MEHDRKPEALHAFVSAPPAPAPQQDRPAQEKQKAPTYALQGNGRYNDFCATEIFQRSGAPLVDRTEKFMKAREQEARIGESGVGDAAARDQAARIRQSPVPGPKDAIPVMCGGDDKQMVIEVGGQRRVVPLDSPEALDRAGEVVGGMTRRK